MVGDKKNGKEGMNMRLGGVKIEQSKTKTLFGIYINSKAIYLKGQVLKRKLQLFKNAILPLTYCRTVRYFCKASDRRKKGKKSFAIQQKEPNI